MNYDELAAGRDTDALIAERVMGRIIYRGPVPQEDLQILEDGGSWIGVPGLGLQPTTETCPRYSTDIAAAFQVAEAMSTRFGMQLSLDMWGGDPWWAEFADRQYIYGAQSTATTAPLAICRAALKALAYKEKLDQKGVQE